MTKTEIMQAAYRAWGREFYSRTSLSSVASELGVCKPALYRHFFNKNALFEAMNRQFFDDFSGFIRADYEKALNVEDKTESIFILIRSVAEFFARDVNNFIFSMMRLHDHEPGSFNMLEELRKRGTDFSCFLQSISKAYTFEPLLMRLVFSTLTFCMAGFHMKGKTLQNPPPETAILEITNRIKKIIGKGLGYSSGELDSIDYEALENRIKGTAANIKDDPLLKAVAGAVAEAGPWEASMEQVARRSGLSKSSLYCHFKSKQDMLRQLFTTEFLRIIDFAKQGIARSELPVVQIYLGIYSIAEYLVSKPDILVALDWIRNRRLNLQPPEDKKPPKEFLWLFEDIDILPLKNSESPFRGMSPEEEGENFIISPWILFLIVKTLMRNKQGPSPWKLSNHDMRILFRFIALGINGFKNE